MGNPLVTKHGRPRAFKLQRSMRLLYHMRAQPQAERTCDKHRLHSTAIMACSYPPLVIAQRLLSHNDPLIPAAGEGVSVKL